MKRTIHSLIPAIVFAFLFSSGCDSLNDAGLPVTAVYGPSVSIGDGSARTLVRFNNDGTPSSVAVVLSPGALNGLPMHYDNPMEGMKTLLLPAEARTAGLPIDHVSLDWNPQGHEPEGLFNLPHFDVHFYMISQEAQMAISPADSMFAEKATRLPDARYQPQGFMGDPSGVAIPMMGYHWLDTTDPLYAPGGGVFQEVFLWGSYDGEIIFMEPMITRAYLETRPNHTEMLAQPQAFAKEGYYPTRYTVRYDTNQREYVIELGGLTHRNAQ